MKRIVASFSGGETSAYMTKQLKKRSDDMLVLFANTAQEREECLQFVHRCDEEFGFNTVWLEADVDPEKGKGTGHKVVTFETASRNGEPFEAVIQKYGIPNQDWPHCTRELKLKPILSYLASIGWDDYDMAVGIRKDEEKRRAKNHVANRIIYPLMDWIPTTKPQVNQYWAAMPFRLELTGYQGNCKWCWKKSLRKHMTLMSEDPSLFDFPERMEKLYGTVGAEFQKEIKPEYEKRVFFRQSLSTADLRAAYEANKHTLVKAEDDSIVLPQRGLFDLDLEDGCIESCEVEFA